MDEGALFRGANGIECGSNEDDKDGDEDCEGGCCIHDEVVGADAYPSACE